MKQLQVFYVHLLVVYEFQFIMSVLRQGTTDAVCNMNTFTKTAGIMLMLQDTYRNENLISCDQKLTSQKINSIKNGLTGYFKKLKMGVTLYRIQNHNTCPRDSYNSIHECTYCSTDSRRLTEGKIIWNRPNYRPCYEDASGGNGLFAVKNCLTNRRCEYLKSEGKYEDISVAVMLTDYKPYYADRNAPGDVPDAVDIGELEERLDDKKIHLLIFATPKVYSFWSLVLIKLRYKRAAIALYDEPFFGDDILKMTRVSMCGDYLEDGEYFHVYMVDNILNNRYVNKEHFLDNYKVAVSFYLGPHTKHTVGSPFTDLYTDHTIAIDLLYNTMQKKFPGSSIVLHSNTEDICYMYKQDKESLKLLETGAEANTKRHLTRELVKRLENCHPTHNKRILHIVVLVGEEVFNPPLVERQRFLEFLRYCVKEKVSLIHFHKYAAPRIKDAPFDLVDLEEVVAIEPVKRPGVYVTDLITTIMKTVQKQVIAVSLLDESLRKRLDKFAKLNMGHNETDIFYILPETLSPYLNSHILESFVYDRQISLRESLSSLISSTRVGWTQYPSYEDYMLGKTTDCLPIASLHDLQDSSHQVEWSWFKSKKRTRSAVPLLEAYTCVDETSSLSLQWRENAKRYLVVVTDDKPVVIEHPAETFKVSYGLTKKEVQDVQFKPLDVATQLKNLIRLLDTMNVDLIIIATPDVYLDWYLTVQGWKHVTVSLLTKASSISLATIEGIISVIN